MFVLMQDDPDDEPTTASCEVGAGGALARRIDDDAVVEVGVPSHSICKIHTA